MKNKTKKWQIIFGFGIFVFTFLSYDNSYARWWYLSLALGFSVFALQFTSYALLRTYALWFGVFLVAQSILSVFYIDHNYTTLLPNLDYSLRLPARPEIEDVQHITTDARGYRTTTAVSYDQEAPLRIFAIGGSTTEQLVIDDRSTFTHLLQQNLAGELGMDVEVVNTGVSGLRAINHIATLEHIANLHPDLVLILVGVNDWNRHILLNYPNDMPKEFSGKAFPSWQIGIRLRNTLLGQLLVNIQMQSILEETKKKRERSRLFVQKPSSLELPDVREFKPSTVSVEYKKHLSTLFNVCKREEIPCIVITQPSAYQETATAEIRRTFWMTPPYANYTLDFDSMAHVAELYNDYLIKAANQKGAPICDIAAQMPPTSDSFYDDVHFNISGARRVAELLTPCVLDTIAKEGIIADR